jgi:carbon monoxide dehydrogenase subunit G
MKVQLEKTFAMPASADTAWVLLQDIERVAGCVPGARITERLDDQHYKGTMAVKFGPASMAFRGEVEVMALEHASKTLRLLGKGTDTTGSSGASMDLTARVEAIDASSCNLVGTSEVSLSGKAAAFGGRMMSSVADQVLKQFADTFAIQVQDLQNRPPPGPPDATARTQSAPTPAAAVAPAPTQLDGLALLWAIVKDWLRSLFAPRRT